MAVYTKTELKEKWEEVQNILASSDNMGRLKAETFIRPLEVIKLSEREGKLYAILLEPIAAGEVGRAMVFGIVPAKVSIQDADDQYAVPTPNSSSGALQSDSTGVARIVWKAGGTGTQWCLLQLGGAGGGSGGDKAYMCRVTGGSQTEGFNVSVYVNGRYDSKTVYSAILHVPELALGSEIPSGSWIIGHKCALKATGGNES